MALIIEDGTGVFGAESYVSSADCATYAGARGLTFTNDPTGDAALRRATEYVDTTYQIRFPGYRTFRRAQSREWPRTGAFYPPPSNQIATFTPIYDPQGFGEGFGYDAIATNAIPPEVINACCLAAIREQAEPGVLLPDLERGGQVQQYRAGSVQIRYSNAAGPNTIFQAIEAALSPLIGRANGLTARAARG